MSALLIVERNLHSEFGHAASQIRALAHYARADRIDVATGRKVKVLPPSSIPENGSDRLYLHPVLASNREALSTSDPTALARAEAQSLRDICLSCGSGPNTRVVIPSASQPELRAALMLAAPDAPHITARILRVSDIGDLTEPEQNALRDALLKGWIHLSCETESLAQVLQTTFALPAAADFVLPCTVLPGDVPTSIKPKSDTFRVGLLGAPRGEKGSFRLPGIVLALAEQSRALPDAPKITLVVQTSVEPKARSLSMAVSLFRARLSPGNPSVEIIWGALTAQDYREQLFGLDAILLPYALNRYATSGSGMILDAVNAGLPVIHTRGMAMQELVSAGNALDATTDAEFAEAILRMAVSPEPFRAAAGQAHLEMLDRIARLPLDVG